MLETIKQMIDKIREKDEKAPKHTELDDLVEMVNYSEHLKDDATNN